MVELIIYCGAGRNFLPAFFIYALVVFLQILANFAKISGNRTGMLN